MEARNYERRMHGTSLVSWVYEYWNREAVSKLGVGCGLEIGVQLRGDWYHRGSIRGEDLFEPGEIHSINVGERYELEVCPPVDRGLQVGFIIYPDLLNQLVSAQEEIVFQPGAGSVDHRLVDLCGQLHAESRSSITDCELQNELLSYVQRHGDVRPLDQLTRARREIERGPQHELYVAHYAEIAQMHPETFTRKFRRRYGMTPIHYRLECRLNEAALLTWSRPELSVDEIGERVGFNDRAFFYREFSNYFGTTPAQYGERQSAVEAA